jgi:DNA-binding winged helix-turn-helix (wHTH) protein/TolB-like protein/Tfp pilus assembly protein PilF
MAETQEIFGFGEFRIDTRKKVLWQNDKTVSIPRKEVEVLSMLVRNRGELVTKNELLDEVWENSFVGENNLSRHIYLLRKTLSDLGAADGLIQNVPSRGYRFAGEVRQLEPDEMVLEKRTQTRTLIEFREERRANLQLTVVIATVVLFLAGGSAFVASRYFGPERSKIRSIAVLPFQTIGGSKDTEHTGTGLADILTTRLSNLKDLRIRPAAASAGLMGDDPVAAGQKLGVDAVLDGTVYLSDGRIRVTARLVNVTDASIVWSGEFEKLREEELVLQREIALQIVPALSINLSSGEHDAIAKHYTESADAYQLYVKGRYEWNKRSNPGMIAAEHLFRNAVAADPNFALAYVGLADTLLTQQPNEQEAAFVVAKALELEPNLAEAHASRGFHLMFLQWRWAEAEAAFKRSLELNPNYATAHHWYATLLAIKGETEAAKSEMHKALELNPISYNFLADLGQLYYFSGDYAEAEKYCLKALDLYPDFVFAHQYLHFIYLKTGQYEKAVVAIEKAYAINGGALSKDSENKEWIDGYGAVFRKSGIKGYLEYRYPGTASSPELFYLYAMKHAFAGEREQALDYLERSTDARMFISAFVKADPVFEPLRTDPRFRAILSKMKLDG